MERATVEAQIPVLDFPRDLLSNEISWRGMCERARRACESHGCFLLRCREEEDGEGEEAVMPRRLREDMLAAMKSLFDLPEETKSSYQNPKPYRSYTCKPSVLPLQESFGIDEASDMEVARSFTDLMWPQGNPKFCETLHSTSSKMQQLNFTILRMIFESFGLEKMQFDSQVEDSTTFFRLMKYKPPPIDGGAESAVGLVPHTDKNAITVLCQNDVQGLEIVMRNGQWASVVIPEDALVVIIGDALKAWSNGRLVAVRHRVVMRAGGVAARYSYGLFTMPKEGAMVRVPRELVEPQWPLLYRPFKFSDYISYFVSNVRDDALELYAGTTAATAL